MRIARTQPNASWKRAKVIAVGVPIAVAIVVALALTSCGDDDDAEGGPFGDVACWIGVQGVDAAVEGLEEKLPVASIIVRIGNQIAGTALCKAAIRKALTIFLYDPKESVDLNIRTQSGIITRAVTGNELLKPPPPPPDKDLDLDRLIACVKWDNNVLYELCADYKIPPPPAFPNTDETRILSLLHSSVASTCKREAADDRYEGSVAGVYCTPGHGIRVWYDLFHTRAALDAMYATHFRESFAKHDSGFCGNIAIAEGAYTQDGEPAGRVFCDLSDDGTPYFEWKHEELLVLATAKAPQHALLARWWKTSGGPCSPCE
jgi:hypothetical protein